jgi:hypothetical protein
MRQDSRAQRFPNPEHASLFSKVFDMNRPEEASWFDPVLLRDNPVFVDPFLLDLTNEPEFRGASREVFEHFKLLYRAVAHNPQADVEKRLEFPEVAETCLGYTKIGTSGSGSGHDRASDMRHAIGRAIEAGLKSPEHFEEISL